MTTVRVFGTASAPRTTLRAPRRATKIDWVHQFLIVLADTDPLVWRRIQVPASYSLWVLHVAIQDAMGWFDCHLHEFRIVPDAQHGRVVRVGLPGEEFGDEPVRPGWAAPVFEVLVKGILPLLYVYDFGDDWQHVVMYEGPALSERGVTDPRCISGARRCPPEDCGGPHGYAELLDAISDPTHERHDELLEWFDPDLFSRCKALAIASGTSGMS